MITSGINSTNLARYVINKFMPVSYCQEITACFSDNSEQITYVIPEDLFEISIQYAGVGSPEISKIFLSEVLLSQACR